MLLFYFTKVRKQGKKKTKENLNPVLDLQRNTLKTLCRGAPFSENTGTPLELSLKIT